jgi:hypothetical protein
MLGFETESNVVKSSYEYCVPLNKMLIALLINTLHSLYKIYSVI